MKRFAAVVLALVLALSGCAKQPEEKTPEELTAEKIAAVLKLHCYTMDSMNPLVTKNNENLQVLRLLFESLYLCDETQKAQPVLAQGCSVSPDGLLWTVTLKDGVTWHDGTAFTAANVAWTYNFVLRSREESAFYQQLQNVERVEAAGNTVQFTLKEPQALFANVLDVPIIKNREEFQPVGTGAYCYRNTQNRTIYLDLYQGWHGAALPSIAQIEVKQLPDKETSVYAYEAKEIDAVLTNGLDWGSYSSNSENAVAEYPTGDFNYLSINPQNPELADVNVRRAIAHSIDKNRIRDEVLLSRGSVADTCINSAWWVYNEHVTTYDYDPEKARAYLAEAAAEQLRLELLVNRDNRMKVSTAQLLQDQLAAVGIELAIVELEWEQLLSRVQAGNYQMYLASICYGPDINPVHALSSPSAEVLRIEEELQQQGDDGVIGKYYELQEAIAREMQIIPLYFDVGALLYNRRISGTVSPVRTNVFRSIAAWTLN